MVVGASLGFACPASSCVNNPLGPVCDVEFGHFVHLLVMDLGVVGVGVVGWIVADLGGVAVVAIGEGDGACLLVVEHPAGGFAVGELRHLAAVDLGCCHGAEVALGFLGGGDLGGTPAAVWAGHAGFGLAFELHGLHGVAALLALGVVGGLGRLAGRSGFHIGLSAPFGAFVVDTIKTEGVCLHQVEAFVSLITFMFDGTIGRGGGGGERVRHSATY